MSQNSKPEAFKGERGNVYKFNLREHPGLVQEIPGFNVRQDFGDLIWLKESIIENGMKVPASGYYREGVWYVTDGHRRFRAALMAVEEGHDVIFKIEAEPKGYTEGDRLADMLTRNSGEPLKMLEETGKSKVTAKDIEGARKGGERKKKAKDFTVMSEEQAREEVEAQLRDNPDLGKTSAERQTAADGYAKVMEQARATAGGSDDLPFGNPFDEEVPPTDFPIAQTIVTLNPDGGVADERPLVPGNDEEAEQMFFKITAPQTSQTAAQWIETVLRLLEDDVAKANESDVFNRVSIIEMLRDVAKGDTPFRTFAEQILS